MTRSVATTAPLRQRRVVGEAGVEMHIVPTIGVKCVLALGPLKLVADVLCHRARRQVLNGVEKLKPVKPRVKCPASQRAQGRDATRCPRDRGRTQ